MTGLKDTYAQFTEDRYRELLRLAREHYAFVSFPDHRDASAGSLLWRHDLDLSVHRALALARIEAEEGVRATHFLLLHSAFYNALEPEITAAVREILRLGHALGLHFDPRFYGQPDLDEALGRERALLEQVFETGVQAFSLHNPDLAGWSNDRDEIAGMVNAYGSDLRQRFGYASDSNGYWRFTPLDEVLASAAQHTRLQVLTHPEWWVPEPLSPRERVSRAIDGRAARQHLRYDELMKAMRRKNAGR
jgi:hypothetical protein